MGIEVQRISKTFGRFRALDAVDLAVAAGELVALLGPSGSGKTTLLRIIAGLEQPDRGSGPIRFHDEDVRDRHVRERGVGFVFQHYALFRHLTVAENVAFGLRVRPRAQRPPRREIACRVAALLELVQLGGLAQRYPDQLSGGQRQRVALARALAVEPRVLLLDEPFGALDARIRKQLRAWLRRLHDQLHVTSVFVTHDQEEALELADRVVVMNAGRVEQTGPPDEVFHEPATPFVMDFLGQVNQFHGRLDAGRVVFANLSLDAADAGAGDLPAGEVRIFVRPHDLDVSTRALGPPALRCRVVRVHSAGSVARLELVTDTGTPLLVELPLDRWRTLGIAAGQAVHVRPRQMRVFGAEAAAGPVAPIPTDE